jgi:5-hydroxyisourate hydrolase-like protein (transthyretin family)
VRPRVGDVFSQNEKMGIYMKLYNLGGDEKTHRPSGDITYEVLRASDNTKVAELTEDLATLDGSAYQVTVEKLLPLRSFAPGRYLLRLKVNDKIRNQSLTQSAEFSITADQIADNRGH